MKKHVELIIVAIISVLATLSFINIKPTKPWSAGFNNGFGCSTESITNMYADYVDQWKKEIALSFDEAEIKVLNITPVPDIVGPNEDPDKCVCKGTGVITHGDGHKTSCPYHGSTTFKTMNQDFKDKIIVKPLLLEE